MNLTVTIDSKYCGPPESGNGGYVSGILAKAAHFPAQVTLRKPPPLDKILTLVITDEKVEMLDGETLVADAIPHDVQLEIPQPPTTQPKTKKSRKKKPPPKPIKKVNETLKKKYLLTCAAQHLTYLATSGQAKQLVWSRCI